MYEDLKSQFLRSREICPNLPKSIHEIAEHIANRMGEHGNVSAQKLALLFTAVLEEEKVDDFWLFPQLVDELANNVYTTKFRKICKEVIGINPPIIITPKEYPENISVAVDWWTKAVLFRDTSNMSTAFQKYLQRAYTAEEIAIFKTTLAENIAKDLAKEKEVWLCSNWTAEGWIKEAGDMIGVNQLLGYPYAAMIVYENEVKVIIDSSCWETIWSNHSEL